MQRKDPLSYQLLPDTLLAERFLIKGVLAEGGFSIIYAGRDLNLEMKVAIKEYYPFGLASRNHTSSEEVISINKDEWQTFEKGKENFLKEARVLAQFSVEPGVVSVRDFFTENNTAYIVMDYLEGVTLKTWLKEKEPLSVAEALQLMEPVMATLSRIHEKGLIHRDISPDNIMMLEDNRIKLLDFGAARSTSLTKEKDLTIMLKRGYAPEEQYRSKGNQGPWTDVYALCATLYKCITGVKPDEAIERIYQDKLKRPSQLGISIDKRQEDALMKGLAIFQRDRFKTIDELREQLYRKEGRTTSETTTATDQRKNPFERAGEL